MSPIPSFIQIGNQYFATIKVNSVEDVLKDADGKKIPFDSAARATSAAQREIKERARPVVLPSAPDPDAEIVDAWREQRAQEQIDLRSRFDLTGIEVVVKSRRRITCPPLAPSR